MTRASAADSIGILLVDDHSIVREGLAVFLGREAGLAIVGSVATGEDGVLAARKLRPDLIVMDLVLPTLSGIDAMRRIFSELPQTRIIAFTALHTLELVHRAMAAGADAFVSKNEAISDLLSAITAVTAGNRYVSPVIAALFDKEGLGASLPESAFDRISARERQVLRQIVAGSTSSEIAAQLSLSRKTVDAYRGRLMVKLGVANRSELIRLALAYDLPPA